MILRDMSAATRGSVYIDDVLWEQEQDRGDRDVAGAYNVFKKPRMEKKGVACYECHEVGHRSYECPEKAKKG